MQRLIEQQFGQSRSRTTNRIKRLIAEPQHDDARVSCGWMSTDVTEMQIERHQRPPYRSALPAALHPHRGGVGAVAGRAPTLAGRHGLSVLSLSVPRDTVRRTSLADLWSIDEKTAEENCKTVRREDWQLVIPCHLAETREQAIEDVRLGGGHLINISHADQVNAFIAERAETADERR